MEDAIQQPSGRAKSVAITTAIIGAVTTVAVSFISVMPQLPGNRAEADVQPATEQWQIAGRLTQGEGFGLPLEAEVLLVPAGSPYLTRTDAQGNFLFQGVARGGYFILVRDTESGLDTRLLVGADGAESKSIPLPGGVGAVAIDVELQE